MEGKREGGRAGQRKKEGMKGREEGGREEGRGGQEKKEKSEERR